MSTAQPVEVIDYSNSARRIRVPGAGPFVGIVWALMLIAAFVYVWRYSSNVPSWDEWDMVPTLTREAPVTLSWLWSQHSEHRIPLARLVMLALNRPFGIDFRTAMYFNVILMGGLCLVMIIAIRRLRGESSYADVFFPLLLLNWGQGLNFIWGWQVEFFLSTVIAGAAMLLMAKRGSTPSLGVAIAVGICLILLVGSGAHGVVLVPPLALWLGIAGVVRWRSRESGSQRDGLLLIGLAVLVLLLTASYFIDYEPVPYHAKYRSLKMTLRTASKFITMGFGPALIDLWPWSGRIVIGMLLVTGAVLIVAIWRQPDERLRALGLLLFMAAMIALALAVGVGRSWFDKRYITLAVPLWCAIYFIWDRYLPRRIAPFGSLALVLITSGTLWANTRSGIEYGRDVKSVQHAWEADMTAGMPPYEIISRYGPYLHTDQKVPLEYMPLLRRSSVGSFAGLRDNPPLREVAIPLATAKLKNAVWSSPDTLSAGEDPELIFTLPTEQYVAGIRLKYTHTNEINYPPYLLLCWKSAVQPDFPKDQCWKHSPTGDRFTWERGTWFRQNDPEPTMLVWICKRVSQIRLRPDYHACTFKISEMVLLVPEDKK